MKVTVLGTGAIGYPLTFCNCENCQQARIRKGKSIRKCTSILINDDLLIDLGPDVQTSMTMYGKDMGNLKYLLQTHIHADHFVPALLCTRLPHQIEKKLQKFHIYAHPWCLKYMNAQIQELEQVDLMSQEGANQLNVAIHDIKAGDVVTFANYKVKAIETDHDLEHGSLLYVIHQQDKNLFYATDTPELSKNALKQLENIKMNVIIMDHTFGDVDYSYSHLNEKLFLEQIDKLKKIHCIDENTKIFATHISHEGMKYHEAIEQRAILHGYHIAFDGMELEL